MVAVLDREVLETATGLLAEAAAIAGEASADCSWRGCLCLGEFAAEEGAEDSCRVLQQKAFDVRIYVRRRGSMM